MLGGLGFYPVCPGEPEYLIGSPLFDRATVQLPGGKKFTISAKDNGPQEFYIHGANLNGAGFNRIYLTHEEISKGGELVLQMGSAPDYKWAVAPESRPASPLAKLAGVIGK